MDGEIHRLGRGGSYSGDGIEDRLQDTAGPDRTCEGSARYLAGNREAARLAAVQSTGTSVAGTEERRSVDQAWDVVSRMVESIRIGYSRVGTLTGTSG